MINLTDNAVSEVKRIKSSDPTQTNAHLRVQVVGGGCSGMSYKLEFEDRPTTETDQKFEKDGVTLVIDKKSLLYLSGTELDFSGGLNGKGFVFSNPNAKRTCGCGSSFST
ncbi:MAG: iron-sulfur cluster assembly accessory protein [Bdellovibrionales bacterium]|nr:iron-sulfur cluster assembly accessory protein [Oligoflexia bacterium]MBC7397437.1 iron-sulfur cluster assembly accessory protein [Oligoflexia bacterium]